jgi:hypothetical protein
VKKGGGELRKGLIRSNGELIMEDVHWCEQNINGYVDPNRSGWKVALMML